MKVRRPGLLLLLLVLFIGATLLTIATFRPDTDTDTPDEVSPPPIIDLPVAAEAVPEPAAPVLPALLEPMPAADAPIAAALPALQARADAGDSKAACRLGIELLGCRYKDNPFERHSADFARQETALQDDGKLDDADDISRRLLANAEIQKACAGIDGAQSARAGHYLRQAALAGEPEAMLRYARGETFSSGTFEFLRSPEFDLWRRESGPLLQQALRQGRPEAVLAMVEAHFSEGPLAMLTPRDAVEAQASLELAQRLFGADPALAKFKSPGTLDPDARARATRLAEERHVRAFQGGRLVLAESTAALSPLNGLYGDGSPWPHTGAASPPCADASPESIP